MIAGVGVLSRCTRREALWGGAALGAATMLARPFAAAASAAAVPLSVDRRIIDVGGRAATVFGLVQPDGTPGLTATAGSAFRVDLVNRLAENTLVHWHGLTPPSDQDGVPVLSRPELPPGQSYGYDFLLARPGTNWMHSHVGLQEQQMLAAPLIVTDPAETGLDEQAVIVLLHDFSFRDPAEILAGLGGKTSMPTSMDPAVPSAMSHAGMTMSGTAMPGMAMGAVKGDMTPDLNDVAYDAFLANDRTLADPEVVRVAAGGRVRLRVINAAAASNMHVDLGALQGVVTDVDGMPVVPVTGSRFPLGVAQRLDVRLQLPREDGAWPVLALVEGLPERTGVILATAKAKVRAVPLTGDTVAPPIGFDLEASLRARDPLTPRAADRRHALALNGSMAPYVWTIGGRIWGDHLPLDVRLGERVEIEMRNLSMMAHPMHLHGHHFQVVGVDDRRIAGALRDTLLVPPMRTVTIAFDADNPGRWALHCHQLYHMATGMMTEVRYVV